MTTGEHLEAAREAVRRGDLAAAEAHYRAVLAIQPVVSAVYNLAVICDDSGRSDEARGLFEALARGLPNDARSQYQLGTHYRRARLYEQAEAAYRRALDLDPDHPGVRADLGTVLMAMGRLREGAAFWDERPARKAMLAQNPGVPEWRGEPLAGKRLFLWREQGFGDQIMMARFLPQLQAGSVTYAGRPELARLFSQLPLEYQAAPGQGPATGHDFWTLPCSLPRWLGTELASLPSAPYLTAAPRTSGGRIGFAWRGEASNANNSFRSLPPELSGPLLRHPGVVSLHPEDSGAGDFQDTAELIAGLDLVISIDTSVAHLAGAMGKPCWVLLPAHGLDWHWMRGEGPTPWYPSVRRLRQAAPGDWTGVLQRVHAELDLAGF
jgi:hypothetical protein